MIREGGHTMSNSIFVLVAFLALFLFFGFAIFNPRTFLLYQNPDEHQPKTADDLINDLNYPRFLSAWFKKSIEKMAARGECKKSHHVTPRYSQWEYLGY
jgi:hypothetical protein